MQADDKCRKYYKLSYLTTTTTIYYYIETYVSSIKNPEIMPTLEGAPLKGLLSPIYTTHPKRLKTPPTALFIRKVYKSSTYPTTYQPH